MPTEPLTAREQFLEELTRERYAPVLPRATRPQPRARQTVEDEPAKPKRHRRGARPTGTGWPA